MKTAGDGIEVQAVEGEEMPRQCGNLTEKCGKEKKLIALNSVPIKTENKYN